LRKNLRAPNSSATGSFALRKLENFYACFQDMTENFLTETLRPSLRV
jgi:hypothetical protein